MKQGVKGFLIGVAAAVAASAILTVCAQPIEQTIGVIYDNYRIIIDGQDKSETPDDSKPFIYNGRTYVPLRYIGEAMGKQVSWDGNNLTIYINDDGSMNEDIYFATAGYDKLDGDGIYSDSETKTVYYYVYKGSDEVKSSITYNLNGLAKKVAGTIDMSETPLNEAEGKVTIYDQDDRVLYQSPAMRNTTNPIPFEISVAGALQIRVEFSANHDANPNRVFVEPNIKIKDFRYSQ